MSSFSQISNNAPAPSRQGSCKRAALVHNACKACKACNACNASNASGLSLESIEISA